MGYCLGPGGEVKMGVKMEEKLAPIRNLIAKIEVFFFFFFFFFSLFIFLLTDFYSSFFLSIYFCRGMKKKTELFWSVIIAMHGLLVVLTPTLAQQVSFLPPFPPFITLHLQ